MLCSSVFYLASDGNGKFEVLKLSFIFKGGIKAVPCMFLLGHQIPADLFHSKVSRTPPYSVLKAVYCPPLHHLKRLFVTCTTESVTNSQLRSCFLKQPLRSPFSLALWCFCLIRTAPPQPSLQKNMLFILLLAVAQGAEELWHLSCNLIYRFSGESSR